MTTLSEAALAAWRARTFGLDRRVTTVDEAVAFVAERGFVYFWPIKGILFPSLWSAVAGDRPVANEHDDPGHVTWGWKDQLLDQRRWYYAKILRGKATLIDLELAPTFYALSENYGEPERDYLEQYAAGRMTREARMVYEALLTHGPLDTIRLRREAQLSGSRSKCPFERALVALQRDFKILPVGVAQAGAWRYSHVYAPVHIWYPELPGQARATGLAEARRTLLDHAFAALGAATTAAVRRLFQWRPADLDRALAQLAAAGALRDGVALPGGETGYAVPELVD